MFALAARESGMLLRAAWRSASSAASAVGDFSALRVVPYPTGQALEASAAYAAGTELFRFTGKLRRENIGDRSLQVGREAHLSCTGDEEEPWVFLNHSFNPTIHLSHAPVRTPDEPPPVLTATANVDLLPGAPLTIDYTLHEWEMFQGGFECAESGRQVNGFKHLLEKEKDAKLSRAAQHVRSLHLQFLFGSESRC